MEPASISIARRFSGPPNSANGGYTCGRMAAFVDNPAEVTLHLPPPLETALALRQREDRGVELWHGDKHIASGKPAPCDVGAMPVLTFDDAALASERTFDVPLHRLAGCFVCGPDRAAGDGLRIHPGPVDPDDHHWTGVVAAPWIPDAGLADDDGLVRSEFVWAALDCPTAYACSGPDGLRSILLGRQTLEILRRPACRSRCVITARQTAVEGRKFFAESVLCDDQGERLAACRAIWIEVSPEVQRGLVA